MPNSSSSAANVPGHRLAVDGAVRERARRREAERAGGDALAHDGRHRLDVLGVAGSLRAPRSPITKPRTAPCGTCVPMSIAFGSRSSVSRYSGNDSHPHWMPADSAAPGMSSTPSIRPMSHSCRSGATGAKPTPQLPITTVVTPCQHDGVSSGSHVTWPS